MSELPTASGWRRLLLFKASLGVPAVAFAGIEDPLAPKLPPGPVDVWNSSVWTIASLILLLVAAVAIAWICWWGARADAV